MNRWEKEVQQSLLGSEEDVMKMLEKQYNQALKDINNNVKLFQADIDLLDQALSQDGLDDAKKALLQSQKQSKVYRQQYQIALKSQVSSILDKMHSDNYTTIDKYLKSCYETGYIGTMYDIAKQGIPLIMPIDQAAAVRAILTDSKIRKGLYNALGVDVNGLKKTITHEISRGIATGMSYGDIARNISNVSKAPLNRANVIARTEGHRIQQASTMDAQRAAKKKGADVVKQWDSTLDGKTRPTHRQLDGQIREVDEPFEIGGKKADAPGYFGDPAEDCNCRCVSLTRAKWALDEDELQTLKDRAEYFGLDNTKNFEDFREKYLNVSDTIEKYEKSGKMVIPDMKLTGYALNPAVAPDKAAAFKAALGYTMENADLLKQNITDNLYEERFVEKGDKGHGMRYEFIMELTGLNGKKANVLTAWIQDGEEKRMTSLYVTRREVTK